MAEKKYERSAQLWSQSIQWDQVKDTQPPAQRAQPVSQRTGQASSQAPVRNRPSGNSNLSNLLNQEIAQVDQKINLLKSLPNNEAGLRASRQTGMAGTRDQQLRVLQLNRDRLVAKAAGGKNESFLGDIGSAVSSGAANFDKAIGYATGNVGLQQQARRRQQISGAEMTDYGREAREKGPLGEDMSFGQRAYATALALAESTPELAATAVIASAVGAAAPVAGTAAIGAKILSSAPRLARFLTAGSGAAASTSAKVVGERAIAAVANMGLSGTQAGLATGSDTTAQVLEQINNDPEAFANSRLGKELLNENGGDFEAAKVAAANSVGRNAAMTVGAVEALMTLPASVFEARLLTGGTRRGIAKEAGSGLVSEGISEAPASANEQLVQNLSMQAVGSDVGTLDGVAKAAGEGFIVGGALGGGLGAGGSVVNRLTGNAPDDQPRPAEDEELVAALSARGEATPPREGGGLIEDQNAVALRGMDNIAAGGMNYTPEQIMDFARNNESNPRIADIMSQPVSDVTKVQQVARILNQEEVSRVEPEAVRRISGMFGGTNSVSSSKQMIADELAKISPAVIAESPTLSSIAKSLESTGKQFVSGLRNAVSNYQPTAQTGTLFARPERGGEGSVIMSQEDVTNEAQREREAQQAFRLADVRQRRFDTATGELTQREDLRAGAPEPENQFFLNPAVYGEDLGGIAATIVGAEGGKVRIQYESPTEVDGNGTPVIISEDVDPTAMFDRVVRGTPRMSQELAGDMRKPRKGTGTDLNPRQSVDRTSTRALVPTQDAGLPATISPTRMTGFEANTDQLPVEQQAQNAQANPQQERAPNVEGNVEGPNEISGAPATPRLQAPEVQTAPAEEATPTEETAPAEEAAPVETDQEPAPKKPAQDDGGKVEKHVENIEDKILNDDRNGVVRYATKVHKEGLIDDAGLAEIKRMSKDKDMGAEDIGAELVGQLDTKRDDGGKRYSGRRETVRAPRKKASDVVRDTPLSKDKTPDSEEVSKPDIDYDAVIQDRLDKIAARGAQGKVVASRLRSLLKQNNYDVTQLYYAFQMGEVVSRVLPKNAKVDILFVPSITASDAKAAAASGVDLGEEAGGSYDAYKISPNGFRGLITLSLSDNVTGASRENAAHEAFHVIQDMLRAYDPDAFKLLNNSFRDDMRIDDLDPSILRKLKTLTTDGEGSVYDGLIASLGDTPLSRFEAQAVAFGALVDAKDRGVDMKGLKASFIRVVDFISDMLRGFRNIFRINGVESVAEIFDGYRTGKAQESMTEAAPLRDDEQQIQYSGRRYNPEKGVDSAIENLKEDIADVGGEVLDATSIDELISSDQIPVITVKDLIGKKIFGTISDRTAAAALYTGIDSSKTVAIPLLGGPNFPLRMSNIKELLAWANRGGAILTKKMNKVSEGANYMMVIMGSADMHKSNTTVNNAYFATLEAYARDGRISGDAAEKLTTMIQSAKDADPRIKKYLEEFPSFSDVEALDKYIHRISFDARKRIMDILDSKAALELGAPSLKQVLDATREPSMAGHRWGDGVLVLELIGDGVVSLGENGTQAHPDFPLGIKGRVVGRLETPVNYELLWQDFIAESKRKTKSRGKTPTAATARYDFQQSLPVVEVTQELADKIGDLSAPNIDSARQARLASDMAASNWRTSDQAKNKGGVSTQEFVDAINNSPAKSVLNEYATKDVNADIKAEKMRVFQLGNDGQIFFALKKGDPQYAEDYGIEIPMISKDEVMVTAVINNEQGARGIAGPAVMLKAIQEGATVLDCFAVKTKKFPDGFLPALYKAFGFTKVAEVPFAPEYYSKQKLDDAVKYWQDSSSGYNPKTDGYPPLVIMKWTGTDEQRQSVLDRYLQSGIEGLLTGGARANVEAAADEFDVANRNSSRGGGATAVSERAGGTEGAGAGASVASRARAVVEEIAGLSDQQLENLGLTKEDRLNAQSKTAGVQYSGRTSRAVYTPERTEKIIEAMSDGPNESKGWMTFMSPDEFLGLTLSKSGRDILATMDPTKTRARPLNIEELRQVSEPLFLTVREAGEISEVQRQLGVTSLPWQVMGHEGRHRMAAFKDAGIEQLPVVLMRQNGAAQLEDIANISLAPQRGGRSDQYNSGDTSIDVGEATPINNQNADRIRDMMSGEGIRFSGVRRPANLNIGGRATKPSIRPNAPKFKTGPAVLGVDPMAERFPRLVNWYEKLVNRTRSVKQLTKNIDDFYNDKTNIDRAEQLMGSRAAYTTQEFHLNELKPVLKEIGKQGLSINEVETYMHNRHAAERNAVIRQRNDAFQDGGSGINDAAAKAYLAALSPAKRNRLEAVAKKLDVITNGTLQVLQDSGVESAETVRNLRNAYKFYVPLFREGVDGGHALGTHGASVEGSALKAAVGSSKPVSSIIANIVTQREAAINRAEANRLGNTVFQAALENKDQTFWMVIDPSTATLDQVRKQLVSMGMDPDLADDIFKSPTKRAYNKRTGNVDTIVDTAFKRQPNVFATRVDGTDKFIVFNPDEKMATDIAAVLKNEDLKTLEGASGAFINGVGNITRMWSQLRTQYMPEFGPVNFSRDIWGVMVNLTSTPLDGEQFKIMAKAPWYAKKLVRVIRATDSGEPTPAGSQEVADLFDRFEKAGGRTAIRESFFKNFDRDPKKLEAELQKAVKQLSAGKTSAPKVVVDWVTAWNDALENGTRLATFKIAIDKGMTDAQAAEIAKNITVNFNQKGQWTREINSLYGFANASIASTDRNIKTMLGKAGKKILIGGVGLGVIQGLALAAAGYDEDDIPEWVKDHAFIIPLGLFVDTDKYVAIPMPYFYNMFPAIGRRMVEAARGQLSFGEFVGGTAKVMVNSVNPIAYGAGFIEFVSPSVFDMAVQYAANKDGLGRRIYNENFNDLNPSTGMSRARGDTTVMYAMYSKVAEVINDISGGDDYEVGSFSPTPEEIKFFVEQTLPPMQFLYRSTATLEKGSSGEQIEANDIAFVRRFYGEVGGKTAEGGKFYDNVKAVNELKRTVKLREENDQDTTEIFDENPKAELIDSVGSYYRDVSDLRRERRQMILEGAKPSETQKLDDEITAIMTEFNDLIEEAEKR
jgi:hypothetical protein